MSSKDFVWTRKKYCKRCGQLFATTGKYAKICNECTKVTGGYYPKAHYSNSHWKNFLLENNISENDLRRIRKNVNKEPKRVPFIHGC